MSDRVLRDELLHSDRWASLPTDTHRLIFVSLLLICDDYGNIEGGPRRLFRWAHGFTQVKTENDMTKIMSDLQDARGDGEQEGMVMRYEVAGKEYWHLCRFTNTRRYWSRKYPKSPYQEKEQIESKHDDAKNPSADLRTPLRRPADGVGVGVGEVKPPASKKPDADLQAVCRLVWNSYSNAYAFRYGVDPIRNAKVNSAIKGFCKLVAHTEAPHIAAFYVGHQQQGYVRTNHPVTMLLRDAEALRMQWATNRQTTDTQARQNDQRAARGNTAQELIDEFAAKRSKS